MCSCIRAVGWRFIGTSRSEDKGIRGDTAPSANFFQKILSPILTESGDNDIIGLSQVTSRTEEATAA